MQIVGPNSSSSAAFVVNVGKQVTLSAQGMSAGDTVVIEIVTLSSAPDFKGNPCCDISKFNIEVIDAVPLKCPDGSLVTLTAEYPWVVLDAPQMVTMRAHVTADAGAPITVDLNESDSDGCTACACRTKPCEDTVWTPTGDERCVGTNVEREEVSNCGTPRWVVDRAQTWVDTGDTRCVGTNVEKEQENDCKATRWVVSGPQVWTPTGDTRCNNHLIEQEEVNDCGKTRWVATTEACGFCASYPVPLDSCDGQAAFGFRDGDVKDPLATVQITNCEGEDAVYFYPSAGPGHSVPVKDCDGNIIGYGANSSECASGMPSRIEIGSLPALKIEKLPDLTIGKLPDLTIGEMPVVEIKRHLVQAIRVDDEVWTYWSDGTKQVEKLVVPVPEVVYCPSLRVSCDGQAGFGYHINDPKDPAATVEMAPCAGDTSVDSVWIYPSPAPGHTVKITDCDGKLIGYAANQSDCAADCGCPKDPVVTVNNKFSPTTNVAAPAVAVTVEAVMPDAPLSVLNTSWSGTTLVLTMSDGTTREAPAPLCD